MQRTAIWTSNANGAPTAEFESGVQAVALLPTPANLEQLFERYGDPVLNYCYYRLGTWEDAEDTAQQVFAKALAAIDRFYDKGDDPERSIRSWLFTIAHHEVANRHRSNNRRRDAPLEMAFNVCDPGPSPEELAVAADRQGRVLGLISQLSHDQRQVIELRLAGLSDIEISSVLGRNPGAVRAIQFRAIARLRALFGVDLQDEGRSDV